MFSQFSTNGRNDILFHHRDVHGLDLGVLAKRHSMDTFSFIRLVFIVEARLWSGTECDDYISLEFMTVHNVSRLV